MAALVTCPSPVYSSYGYGRWKRSAEAEPVAEAEADPEADPSRFGYGHGGFSHVSFNPYTAAMATDAGRGVLRLSPDSASVTASEVTAASEATGAMEATAEALVDMGVSTAEGFFPKINKAEQFYTVIPLNIPDL
nr:uncharacterized protein LOC113829766 [Penaeus vannamei]